MAMTKEDLANLLASFKRSESAKTHRVKSHKEPLFTAPYLAHVPNDDPTMLKREYKRIAAKLHPDVNSHPNATNQFQELQLEYETKLN